MMNMRIGIIGPSECEIMPFVDKMENRELHRRAMITFYTGIFEGVNVVAAFSGVCKVNAAITTQIMIDRFDITHVILTGVAGALSQALEIGDIVIGDEICYHDVAREILTEYHPWMDDIYFRSDKSMVQGAVQISKSLGDKCYVGRIITGEAFITESERDKLIESFQPLCVDMESASVAHVCFANSIPFVVIRSMSDFANDSGLETFENNVVTSSLNSLRLVEKLVSGYRSGPTRGP